MPFQFSKDSVIPKKQRPPAVDDQHVAIECGKCGGNGFFCLGLHNNTPYSNTGFECWRCNGTGYLMLEKQRVRVTVTGKQTIVEIGIPVQLPLLADPLENTDYNPRATFEVVTGDES